MSDYTAEAESPAESEAAGGQEDDAAPSADDGAHAEEEKKEPEPEPEPDPLEGLTYDDDPDEPLPLFGDVDYWVQRYTDDPDVFEWYQDPETIVKKIKDFIKPESRVLVVGTGNSDLAPQILAAGVESVTAIDFARPAIVKSRRRNRETEGITWKVMDVRKMTFADGDFDVIVDKATLDCVFFVGEGEVFIALSEIARVLKSRGVYLCISCVPPESRKPFLHRPTELRMKLEEVIQLDKLVPCAERHYLYVSRKIGKIVS
jgi:ubiquinone/menaquinone biosynthesis C-methylase UbiE